MIWIIFITIYYEQPILLAIFRDRSFAKNRLIVENKV